MRIIDGQLWSPFYIMVKDYGGLKFNELFQQLNIDRYSHQIKENKLEIGSESLDVLFAIRRGNWVQIMDNWGYKLWHDKQIRKDVEQLSKSYEIFQFSIGDIDYSYDFAYYKNGVLKRKFAIEADHPSEEIIKENFGSSLKGESETKKYREPFDKIRPITNSIGIPFEHDLNEIEVFSKNKADLKIWKKAIPKRPNSKTKISFIRKLFRF